MPRTKAKPMPLKIQSVATPSEEWEDWMDWDNDRQVDESEEPDNKEKYNPVSDHQTPKDAVTKKRKFSFDDNETADASMPSTANTKRPAQDRSHSVVEKRYRENLNQKIADLRDCIPALRKASEQPKSEHANPPKQNKASILTEAMAYIRQLERRNSYLEDRCQRAEGLSSQGVRSGQGETGSSEDSRHSAGTCDDRGDLAEEVLEDQEAHQGLIPVPEEMRRLWDEGRSQEHYADRIRPEGEGGDHSSISVRGGKYIGRMVFGSLAGLMVIDGIVTPQKPAENRDTRGLSALPMRQILPLSKRVLQLRKHLTARSYSTVSPLINAFLIFGVCGLLLFLYLYYSKPPPRKNGNRLRAESMDNLISPQEIRQNAWLTSIQTVWVPRRHMLLEMMALILETAAYLTRQCLGWQCYSWLTGSTEEQEIARVRAWEIALDAQLSGGDPELSKTRLVLTLWASGTLPSTPARLMLKAMHIRVLFWRASRLENVTRVMHAAARMLSQRQWAQAAKIQQSLEQTQDHRGGDEPLTESLGTLLREEYDHVFTDLIIQRAYNLAWNIANDDAVSSKDTPVNENVADSAMLGPLDKLALWYAMDQDLLKKGCELQPCTE